MGALLYSVPQTDDATDSVMSAAVARFKASAPKSEAFTGKGAPWVERKKRPSTALRDALENWATMSGVRLKGHWHEETFRWLYRCGDRWVAINEEGSVAGITMTASTGPILATCHTVAEFLAALNRCIGAAGALP